MGATAKRQPGQADQPRALGRLAGNYELEHTQMDVTEVAAIISTQFPEVSLSDVKLLGEGCDSWASRSARGGSSSSRSAPMLTSRSCSSFASCPCWQHSQRCRCQPFVFWGGPRPPFRSILSAIRSFRVCRRFRLIRSSCRSNDGRQSWAGTSHGCIDFPPARQQGWGVSTRTSRS